VRLHPLSSVSTDGKAHGRRLALLRSPPLQESIRTRSPNVDAQNRVAAKMSTFRAGCVGDHFECRLPEAVGEKEVVRGTSGGRQRVRDVAHFVSITDTNDVGKVVLDDSQMIPMIRDVRRQQAPQQVLFERILEAPEHREARNDLAP